MRKRSKYRPRPVVQDPLGFVLSGMRPLSGLKDQYLTIQLKQRTALEAVRKGMATKNDIDVLMAMANMTEALAKFGKGSDWMEEILASQEQLRLLAESGAKRGMRFVMNYQQWEALKDITDLHEVQLENCTVYDIERAYDYVEKRLRAGHVTLIPINPKEPNEQEPKDS